MSATGNDFINHNFSCPAASLHEHVGSGPNEAAEDAAAAAAAVPGGGQPGAEDPDPGGPRPHAALLQLGRQLQRLRQPEHGVRRHGRIH